MHEKLFCVIDHLQNITFWIVATVENGVFCKWPIVFQTNTIENLHLIVALFVSDQFCSNN
jgi:hypothetical protein